MYWGIKRLSKFLSNLKIFEFDSLSIKGCNGVGLTLFLRRLANSWSVVARASFGRRFYKGRIVIGQVSFVRRFARDWSFVHQASFFRRFAKAWSVVGQVSFVRRFAKGWSVVGRVTFVRRFAKGWSVVGRVAFVRRFAKDWSVVGQMLFVRRFVYGNHRRPRRSINWPEQKNQIFKWRNVTISLHSWTKSHQPNLLIYFFLSGISCFLKWTIWCNDKDSQLWINCGKTSQF